MSKKKPKSSRRLEPDDDCTVDIGFGERLFVGHPDPDECERLLWEWRESYMAKMPAGPFDSESDAEWLDRLEAKALPEVRDSLLPISSELDNFECVFHYQVEPVDLDLGDGTKRYVLQSSVGYPPRNVDGQVEVACLIEHEKISLAYAALSAIASLRQDSDQPQVAANLGRCMERLRLEEKRILLIDAQNSRKAKQAGAAAVAAARGNATPDEKRIIIDAMIKVGQKSAKKRWGSFAARQVGAQVRTGTLEGVKRPLEYGDSTLRGWLPKDPPEESSA